MTTLTTSPDASLATRGGSDYSSPARAAQKPAAAEPAGAYPDQRPFRWETRIRFIDVDATGRIHNTSLMRYFESTEIEFLRSLGLDVVAMAESGFPRVRFECDFLGALRFDDLVTFELRIGKLGHASVRFDYLALKAGQAAARGSVTVVCVNPQTGRPMAFSEELAEKLTAFAEPASARHASLLSDPRISYSGYLA